MRIAVIADLHANLPALQAVLDDLARVGVDEAYCVGDVVGRGPHPREVIDHLRAVEIPTVQGNWDEAVGMDRDQSGAVWDTHDAETIGHRSLTWTQAQLDDEQRMWLRNLPAQMRVDLNGRSALFFHGSPLKATEYLWADRPSRVMSRIASGEADDLFCFGHTHEAFHRQVGPAHFVAAGSVGCGIAGDARARYAIVYIGEPDIAIGFRAVDYDRSSVMRDMTAAGLSLDLLRVPPARHMEAPGADGEADQSDEPGTEALAAAG